MDNVACWPAEAFWEAMIYSASQTFSNIGREPLFQLCFMLLLRQLVGASYDVFRHVMCRERIKALESHARAQGEEDLNVFLLVILYVT